MPSQSRLSAILGHLDAVDDDLWVLTETHEVVGPVGIDHSVCSAQPDRDSKPGERWVGIRSRTMLEPLQEYVSDPARCAAASALHPEVGHVVIYGCVLPWIGSTWRGIPAASGEAFLAALGEYSRDWERLRARFPESLLVVAGDFNQSMVDWHYYGSNRQRAALEDALAASGLRALTAGEGDPIARDSAPRACIDHICVSDVSGLETWTFRWPDAPDPDPSLSDHFGVAADVVRG